MEGKSLDSRDGCLKQDKQERRRKLWTGKIGRGFKLYATIYCFSLIVNKDKYTGWQTSHPPLCPPTWDKKLENVYFIFLLEEYFIFPPGEYFIFPPGGIFSYPPGGIFSISYSHL